MLKILLEFFSVYQKISIPETGTIAIEKNAALPDITIVFNKKEDDVTRKKFENFAEKNYGKSGEDIRHFYNDFREKLHHDHELTLDGLGVLSYNDKDVSFRQTFSSNQYIPELNSGKTNFKKVEQSAHAEPKNVLTQPSELSAEKDSKHLWWVYVLIALLVAGAGYYFYIHYFRK